MVLKEFKKDEIIFREGSLGHCMYKIEDGSVRVVIGYGTGKEQKLADLSYGQFFGEMAILEAWPRSATVIASEDHTKVLEIGSAEVDAFFTEEPEQIREIMITLSRRLRVVTEDYMEVCRTISEMKDNGKEYASRKEGLLKRISKALGINGFFKTNNTVLEAMNRYEKIEEIHSQLGQSAWGKKYARGQVIFRQGDPGENMYFIGVGAVDIMFGYETENQKKIATLKEGEFFGEMGLIEKLPRSATAVAAENDTVLTPIAEGDLNLLFEKEPDIILLTLQHLSSRLRKQSTAYVKACQTVAAMKEAEEEEKELTPEEKARINYYVALARAQTPGMMIY